jgi:hypothetical protein
MYKLINGWTKEKVMKQIKKYNNDRVSFSPSQRVCVYQTRNGANRCAVGCFIPDGHPGLKHEGDVESLLTEYPDLKTIMPFDILEIADFQCQHDILGNSMNPNSRPKGVHKAIKRFLDEEVE